MVAPDSSVLIAAAEVEHPFFGLAGTALAEVRDSGRLIGHTVAETYSRLTSVAFDWTGRAVHEYLARFLDRPPIGLSPARYPEVLRELSERGVLGAAVYDGLIAISAREAGAVLLSLDLRARPTYLRCEVEYRLLQEGR